ASPAATLFAAAPAAPRPWLRGIVWLVRGDDVVPPAVAFDGWQRAWLAVPEVASFVAGSCEHGRLHVDESVAATVADGELVLTPRGDAASPVALATRLPAWLRPAV